MAYQDITLVKEGHVATLTLNRPDKMNSVTFLMGQEITSALNDVNGDDNIRVLILTGAGDRAFCAGGDVGMQTAGIAGQLEQKPNRYDITKRMGGWLPRFREIRVPTIAAVNGVCVGIGLSLSLACDIRISSDKARYGCVWVNRGLVPDGGATYLLPQAIGLQKALELFYTGDLVNAEEALRLGLVSRVVPNADLMKLTKEFADKIASGPPIAQELTKKGVYEVMGTSVEKGILYETYAQNIARRTEDHKEGVMSFMEKRKATFKGL